MRAGNGNVIFYEDDILCYKRFAISPLINDVLGQSHSLLPGKECYL